nr:energy transducer TonB [Methylosinus sp. Sm6]
MPVQPESAQTQEPAPREEEDPEGQIAQNATQAKSAPPTKATKVDPGVRDTKGEEEERKAQTSARHEKEEDDLVNAYAKQLSKKIRRLASPAKARAAGLHGSATVSFTIAASGQIVASTLRVAASSGQPQLDADALKTVRAASPFAPPPREMSIAVDVFSNGR